MTIQISDTEEAKVLIEQARKKEATFNLSEFVRDSLRRFVGDLDTDNLAIEKEIDNLNLKIIELNNDKSFLEKKKEQILVNREVKKKQEENDRIKAEEEKTIKMKKDETLKRITFDVFKSEQNREMTADEFDEYKMGLEDKTFNGIYHYLEIKFPKEAK